MTRFADGAGDTLEIRAELDGIAVHQLGWRLMGESAHLPEAVFEAWNGLWEGLLASHNHRLRLDARGPFEWRIRPS